MSKQHATEPPATSFPLASLIQEFLIDRQARNLSRKALEWYAQNLKVFQTYTATQNLVAVEAISPTLSRQFLLYLAERGHNAGGLHNIYGAVCAFINWFADDASTPGWPNPLRKVNVSFGYRWGILSSLMRRSCVRFAFVNA